MCLRGVEGVRNLANCCIIFGTSAPSLQRASLKSVGSLQPIPPLPAQTLGVEPSMAQLGSLTAANAAAQNLLDLWPVHGPAPTAPHYTALPTDGWTTYWKSSSLVFSKCFRGFHPPLESSGRTLPQVSMFMFVQQINSYDVSQADNKLLQLLNT